MADMPKINKIKSSKTGVVYEFEDTNLKQRVEALENKPEPPVYDDSAVKQDIVNIQTTLNENEKDKIKRLDDEYVVIWNLEPGLYKLGRASGKQYVCYKGTTRNTSSSYSVSIDSGVSGVVLEIRKYNSDYKTWNFTYATNSYPIIYYGYTTSSSGYRSSKNINSIYTGTPSEVRINNNSYGSYYAPTSYGSKGQILQSNGSSSSIKWVNLEDVIDKEYALGITMAEYNELMNTSLNDDVEINFYGDNSKLFFEKTEKGFSLRTNEYIDGITHGSSSDYNYNDSFYVKLKFKKMSNIVINYCSSGNMAIKYKYGEYNYTDGNGIYGSGQNSFNYNDIKEIKICPYNHAYSADQELFTITSMSIDGKEYVKSNTIMEDLISKIKELQNDNNSNNSNNNDNIDSLEVGSTVEKDNCIYRVEETETIEHINKCDIFTFAHQLPNSSDFIENPWFVSEYTYVPEEFKKYITDKNKGRTHIVGPYWYSTIDYAGSYKYIIYKVVDSEWTILNEFNSASHFPYSVNCLHYLDDGRILYLNINNKNYAYLTESQFIQYYHNYIETGSNSLQLDGIEKKTIFSNVMNVSTAFNMNIDSSNHYINEALDGFFYGENEGGTTIYIFKVDYNNIPEDGIIGPIYSINRDSNSINIRKLLTEKIAIMEIYESEITQLKLYNLETNQYIQLPEKMLVENIVGVYNEYVFGFYDCVQWPGAVAGDNPYYSNKIAKYNISTKECEIKNIFLDESFVLNSCQILSTMERGTINNFNGKIIYWMYQEGVSILKYDSNTGTFSMCEQVPEELKTDKLNELINNEGNTPGRIEIALYLADCNEIKNKKTLVKKTKLNPIYNAENDTSVFELVDTNIVLKGSSRIVGLDGGSTETGGSTEIGGSTNITNSTNSVITLGVPELTKEEYDKHCLYLNDEKLSYLVEEVSNTNDYTKANVEIIGRTEEEIANKLGSDFVNAFIIRRESRFLGTVNDNIHLYCGCYYDSSIWHYELFGLEKNNNNKLQYINLSSIFNKPISKLRVVRNKSNSKDVYFIYTSDNDSYYLARIYYDTNDKTYKSQIFGSYGYPIDVDCLYYIGDNPRSDYPYLVQIFNASSGYDAVSDERNNWANLRARGDRENPGTTSYVGNNLKGRRYRIEYNVNGEFSGRLITIESCFENLGSIQNCSANITDYIRSLDNMGLRDLGYVFNEVLDTTGDILHYELTAYGNGSMYDTNYINPQTIIKLGSYKDSEASNEQQTFYNNVSIYDITNSNEQEATTTLLEDESLNITHNITDENGFNVRVYAVCQYVDNDIYGIYILNRHKWDTSTNTSIEESNVEYVLKISIPSVTYKQITIPTSIKTTPETPETTETWTFTLLDGTIVTKKVKLG